MESSLFIIVQLPPGPDHLRTEYLRPLAGNPRLRRRPTKTRRDPWFCIFTFAFRLLTFGRMSQMVGLALLGPPYALRAPRPIALRARSDGWQTFPFCAIMKRQ